MFYVLQDGLLKAVHSSKWRVAWQFVGFWQMYSQQLVAWIRKFGEVDSLLSCNDCRF